MDELQNQFNYEMDFIQKEYSDEGHDEFIFVTLMQSWLNANGYGLIDLSSGTILE